MIPFSVEDDDVVINLAVSVDQQNDVVELYSISGYILNSINNPVVGVTVRVNDKTVMTNNTGYWQIVDLAEGEYTATASKDGYTLFRSQ
ncbi:MAG: hypothetical protein B6242_17155 [Anaerolineaceae bacterium 4572_78]|nr:MAG: hypothetical protein B6242_17155 [Anaerolineaceae bacterium 4572_78]